MPLIFDTIPIRVRINEDGFGLRTSMDGRYCVDDTGTGIKLAPLFYYSPKPEIIINNLELKAAGVGGIGGLNSPIAMEPIAVFPEMIAAMPSSDSVNYYKIFKRNGEFIRDISIPNLLSVTSSSMVNPGWGTFYYNVYKREPRILTAVMAKTFISDFQRMRYQEQRLKDGLKIKEYYQQAVTAGSISQPSFYISAADFFNPVLGGLDFDNPLDIRKNVISPNFYGNAFGFTETNRVARAYASGVNETIISRLVQAQFTNATHGFNDDFILVDDVTDGSFPNFYTRGIKFALRVPPVGRDSVDGMLLDNRNGPFSIIGYPWTNGDNFGFFVNYGNLNRTYLYIASLRRTVTQTVANYTREV